MSERRLIRLCCGVVLKRDISMYIHGEYRNAVGEVIEVHLLTAGDRT